MLTKDLLRFHNSGTRILPDFIDPADRNLLSYASELIGIYGTSEGLRRAEIEERVSSLVNAKQDLRLARGILKVLDDRCDYSFHAELDYPALRHDLFSRSAEFFRSGRLPQDMNVFRSQLTAGTALETEIYADLPENERLEKVRKTFPGELLERYNMELARSLLLYSASLKITAGGENTAELRRLFKYLKFFRLLCRASIVPPKKKDIPPMVSFEIDGPASILENDVKYGLQLASFFPAVCRLPFWKMSALVKIGNRKEHKLVLDYTLGLKCYFENFGAYVPEELKMFSDFFQKKSPDWILTERQGWRTLPGGELIFPDFTFCHSQTGESFDLELFHPWHRNRIAERLDAMEKGLLAGYLIAVDRSCVRKDPDLCARIKENGSCMLFSNFPGVENVRKLLNSAK